MNEQQASRLAEEVRNLFPTCYTITVETTRYIRGSVPDEQNPTYWIVGVYSREPIESGVEHELFTMSNYLDWETLLKQINVLGLVLPVREEEVTPQTDN